MTGVQTCALPIWLLQSRRVRRLRADDLARLNVPLKKVLPFVLLDGHRLGPELSDARLATMLRPAALPQQASLFDAN